ncbi:MAG: hypothetical protein CBB97_22595 [Candidatus Endolissoclinum sp. TMED37]|nr:MAG: hypothetical protein CBB97_22595 [Candidatus Endolissoclinum sp. TMED37]|tara:strand:- start:4627 stop:6636 length:2010 start_codon:yes stop_codon:yes gene_type:complete
MLPEGPKATVATFLDPSNAVNATHVLGNTTSILGLRNAETLGDNLEEWNKGDKRSFPFAPKVWDEFILFLKMTTLKDEYEDEKMKSFYNIIGNWINSIDNVGDVLEDFGTNPAATPEALSQLSSRPCRYVMMYWDKLKKLYINNRLWIKLKTYCKKIFSEQISFSNQNINTSVKNYIEKINSGFKNGPISFWDTSKVTNMASLFRGEKNFNEPLDWEMSKVENCSLMFYRAFKFNNGDEPGKSDYPLRWNMANVTNMYLMFAEAESFNQELVGFCEETGQWSGSWNTRSVTSFCRMFLYAIKFNNGCKSGTSNKPLEFNSANATDMSYMFRGAVSFNQKLDSKTDEEIWNTKNVVNMGSMFRDAVYFNNGDYAGESNNPLKLEIGRVETLASMFNNAKSFNQNLMFTTNNEVNTDVSVRILSISRMFEDTELFNNGGKPLLLNTDNVTDMRAVFQNAKSFNQSINSWNTYNVKIMKEMFEGAILFNNGGEPVRLRTDNVQDMSYMFSGAEAFNQELVSTAEFVLDGRKPEQNDGFIYYWHTSNVETMEGMFAGAKKFNNGGEPGTSDVPLKFNTERVQSMKAMFSGAESFNQNLYKWNLSHVKDMSEMFMNAQEFNNGGKPLDWFTTIVKQVEDRSKMFDGAIKFNNGDEPLELSTVGNIAMKVLTSPL